MQIIRLEFSHYDVKSSKTIPAKDFALSMVASADMNHISMLLDRVDDLVNKPDLKDKDEKLIFVNQQYPVLWGSCLAGSVVGSVLHFDRWCSDWFPL